MGHENRYKKILNKHGKRITELTQMRLSVANIAMELRMTERFIVRLQRKLGLRKIGDTPWLK